MYNIHSCYYEFLENSPSSWKFGRTWKAAVGVPTAFPVLPYFHLCFFMCLGEHREHVSISQMLILHFYPQLQVWCNLLCPASCIDPCMWLFLAGEGGLSGSSSLNDPEKDKTDIKTQTQSNL